MDRRRTSNTWTTPAVPRFSEANAVSRTETAFAMGRVSLLDRAALLLAATWSLPPARIVGGSFVRLGRNVPQSDHGLVDLVVSHQAKGRPRPGEVRSAATQDNRV